MNLRRNQLQKPPVQTQPLDLRLEPDQCFNLRTFAIHDLKRGNFTAEQMENSTLPNFLEMSERELYHVFGPQQRHVETNEAGVLTRHTGRCLKIHMRKVGEVGIKVTRSKIKLLQLTMCDLLTSTGSHMPLVKFTIEVQMRLRRLERFFEDETKKLAANYHEIYGVCRPDELSVHEVEIIGEVELTELMHHHDETFCSS